MCAPGQAFPGRMGRWKEIYCRTSTRATQFSPCSQAAHSLHCEPVVPQKRGPASECSCSSHPQQALVSACWCSGDDDYAVEALLTPKTPHFPAEKTSTASLPHPACKPCPETTVSQAGVGGSLVPLQLCVFTLTCTP